MQQTTFDTQAYVSVNTVRLSGKHGTCRVSFLRVPCLDMQLKVSFG